MLLTQSSKKKTLLLVKVHYICSLIPPASSETKEMGLASGSQFILPPSPMTSKPCSMLLEQQSQMGSI